MHPGIVYFWGEISGMEISVGDLPRYFGGFGEGGTTNVPSQNICGGVKIKSDHKPHHHTNGKHEQGQRCFDLVRERYLAINSKAAVVIECIVGMISGDLPYMRYGGCVLVQQQPQTEALQQRHGDLGACVD